jgi:hypothetical protein
VNVTLVPPVLVSFTRQNPINQQTSADTLTFRATFSEAVFNVDAGDFVVAGGTSATVTSVAGGSATVDITVSGGDLASFNGTVGIDLSASQNIVNSLGKQLSTAEPGIDQTYTVDNAAPTLTSFLATSPSASLTIPIMAFTASDTVGVSDYIITESSTPPSAGALGWTALAPAAYTVAGDGTYTLYPWAKDAAGNVSAVYGSPASVAVETSAPSVVSSTRASANPTNAASVDFTVTFGESVAGVDVSDFSLTTSGLTGASIYPHCHSATRSIRIHKTCN